MRLVSICVLPALCGLIACHHHVISEEPSATVTMPRTVVVFTGPGISPAPALPNMNIQRNVVVTSPAVVAQPVVATSAPAGTIELSGFKPFKEDLTKIFRVKADHIETDVSGKMTLSGNAVVELQQGVATSKLISTFITVQGGPGFHPEIVKRMN